MTAISKTWVAIADTAVDPDSPLDAALMTGLRDDLVHLREWLGASYTAGAVQDHNHDGSNSAAITIGPNWLRNGGFESGTAGWTLTAYTGGTLAAGTSNETEGTTGLVITSTNATNGGGNAVSNEFIQITAGQTRQFLMTIKSSLANCPVKADVIWYDDAQGQISASTIVSTTTAGPTTNRLVVRRIAAPATAKFCKVKCELPAGGAATGSVYFDAIIVTTPQTLGVHRLYTASGTYGNAAGDVWGDVYVRVKGTGGDGTAGGDGFSGAGGGEGGTAEGWATTSSDITVTVGTAPASSSSFGSVMSATGGASAVIAAGGIGGVGSGGTLNIKGQSGGPGASVVTVGGGGGGGGARGGPSAQSAGNVGTAGENAGSYGKGGGGGGAGYSASGGAAGVHSDGFVEVIA